MLFICLHQQIQYKGSCSDRPSCTCRMVSPSWLLIVMLRSSLPSAKRFWELQQPHVIFFVCLPTRTYTCMMWKLFTKNFIKKNSITEFNPEYIEKYILWGLPKPQCFIQNHDDSFRIIILNDEWIHTEICILKIHSESWLNDDPSHHSKSAQNISESHYKYNLLIECKIFLNIIYIIFIA